jgi:hypothetical protein
VAAPCSQWIACSPVQNGSAAGRSTGSLGIMKASRVINGNAAAFCIALSLLSQSAVADSESLSFRLTSSGQVEAVVSGLRTNQCGFVFLPATSIAIVGNSISITSPNPPPPPCDMPIVPPQPYEVVANLGVLTEASYSVTWTKGVVLSAQLVLASLGPQAVPALNTHGLVLIAMLIGLLGAGTIGRRGT